jgi:hypothetical protein
MSLRGYQWTHPLRYHLFPGLITTVHVHNSVPRAWMANISLTPLIQLADSGPRCLSAV